jgi:hypothetical protein
LVPIANDDLTVNVHPETRTHVVVGIVVLEGNILGAREL